MNLPELVDPSISADSMQAANEVRVVFLETIMGFFNKPHTPELSQQDKDKIQDKIIHLLKTDTRPRFWHNLKVQLTPNTKDGLVVITPTLLKWAGRMKPSSPKNIDPTPKIKHARNGRVIRDPKGL